MKSKGAFLFFLSSLVAATLACSLFTGSDPSGSASGGTDSGVTLSDILPEETHPGDYISYQGFFFAVLQVIDPAPVSADSVQQPGMRNVALEIITGNQNGEMSSPISLSFGGLNDGSGQTYMPNLRSSGSGIEFEFERTSRPGGARPRLAGFFHTGRIATRFAGNGSPEIRKAGGLRFLMDHAISSSPKPGCVWPIVKNCRRVPSAAPNACQASS